MGRGTAPQAAAGSRGVRAPPGGGARSAARGGECEPAAAQLRGLDPARGARGVLGLLRAARHGDAAHARHPDFSAKNSRRAGSRYSRARPGGGRDLLRAGFPRRLFSRRHAPRQHLREHARRDERPLYRTRLRHHGHAHRRRQELPRAEFPGVLQSGLPARGAGASRRRLGAGRHARGRVRGRDPRRVRAGLRPPAEGDLFRQAAPAPVPDFAPLQRRGAAPARDAAEDPAQHRGPGARARPRS